MRYRKADNQSLLRVRDLLGKRVFVYGRGTGFDTLNSFVLNKYSLEILGIIDKQYQYPVIVDSVLHASLRHYVKEGLIRPDDVIIVSIGSRNVFEEVKQELENLTNARIVWAFDVIEYHMSHADPEFLDNVDEFLKTNRTLIKTVRHAFEDEKSRIVFDGVMKYFSGNETSRGFIPSDPLSTQYFPSDFSLPLGNARFINAGAYDGDTVLSMIENLGSLGETTVCFEPDLFNFRRLMANVGKLSLRMKNNVICLPLGLGETCQRLKFRSGSSVNSSIDLTGPEELTVVSIDETLPNFLPTFINMDIEGSEERALRGAIKTIRKSKPDLAICVYHSPHQFLAVPRFLLSLKLGYKFRLRNYTGFPAETVLYATASGFVM